MVDLEPRARSRGRVRVGTSGYQYDHWRDRFYPVELPKRKWLGFYAAAFDTVEINNTFYHLPEEKTFDRWREGTPDDFLIAVKFSRYGSHIKRLKDPEEPIQTFLSRAKRLAPKLGPILVQLPPRWSPNLERLARFLDASPREYRWAIEFRDAAWLTEATFRLLRDHGAALVVHDRVDDHPRELTADWTYLRFHGESYGGCYSPQFLTAEARRIEDALSRGVDVYVYFNNDLEGHAVDDAMALRRYVGNAATSARDV